jgi:secondary thiamine-phosphate synthase enzyme
MDTTLIDIHTGDRKTTDVTLSVQEFCRDKGDGLCNVFVPHATAGLALVEVGAGSDVDLVTAIEDLLPRDNRWHHAHGSRGHGADHVVPALIAPTLCLPVIGGNPQLGTWQSVVLVDTNRDNPQRSLRLSFVSG